MRALNAQQVVELGLQPGMPRRRDVILHPLRQLQAGGDLFIIVVVGFAGKGFAHRCVSPGKGGNDS